MNRQDVHAINQRLITPIDFDVVNYMGFKAAELCGLTLGNNDTVPTEEPNAQEELLKEAVDVLRGIRDNLRKTSPIWL